MRRALVWPVLASAMLGACGEGRSTAPPPAAREALAEGIVAEVGDDAITSETVGRIMAARGVERRAALDAAIRDAVLAAGARADLDPSVARSAERRVLAHALMRALWLESKEGPITDAELQEATEVRWTAYDRPRGFRTVHTVVQVPRDAPEDVRRRAEEHAERLREALEPIAEQARREPAPELDEDAMFRPVAPHPDSIVAAWKDAVDAVDHGDLDVLAQPLPPITAEGRPIDHTNPLNPNLFDEEFTRQAAAMSRRGDLTGVFRSYAGFHVAMLLEITPARRLGREERLEALHDEILRVRGLRARRALLERLREGSPIERPMNVDALLSLVRIELDEG